MAVVGTAGHVDHGKTTLVRALTGIDTDRLPEEKRRGITIELGFAPLEVEDPGGAKRTISIVDVPGHERFVGTMVSGAQGVDVAMLVVAADSGVMPQTREHLVILGALGVGTLIVAMTRCDLVDDETRALARIDVGEALGGTTWANAPIFEVSGRTGEGIDALRAALAEATRPRGARVSAGKAAGFVPPEERPARLPIDRAFVPRGQGVVITGTLVEGRLDVGDELEIAPGGARVRVRGLHVHGAAVQRTTAGRRVAIALSGIELADVRRGDVVIAIGSMRSSRAFDAIFTRPPGGRAFGRKARIAVHAGTDEVPGRLVALARVDDVDTGAGPSDGVAPSARYAKGLGEKAKSKDKTQGASKAPPPAPSTRPGPAVGASDEEPAPAAPTTIAGGDRVMVRVVLTRPVAVAVGDRLVVRGDAPLASIGTTLGALEVIRVSPGRMIGGRARYGRTLAALLEAPLAERAQFEIEAAGLAGLTPAELGPRLPSRVVPRDLARALTPLELRSGTSPGSSGSSSASRWVSDAARSRAADALLTALRRFHAEHPDDEGAPLASIIAAVPPNAAPGLADRVLERAIADGKVSRHGERVRLSSFAPRARADDPVALEIQRRLDEAPLAPPTLQEICGALGLEASRARALATALGAAGKVVHVQGDLWFARPPLDDLRGRLVEHLKSRGSITTGEFKELVGSSRKYVVPLAEWFDGQKVTLRVGDVRKLRQG